MFTESFWGKVTCRHFVRAPVLVGPPQGISRTREAHVHDIARHHRAALDQCIDAKVEAIQQRVSSCSRTSKRGVKISEGRPIRGRAVVEPIAAIQPKSSDGLRLIVLPVDIYSALGCCRSRQRLGRKREAGDTVPRDILGDLSTRTARNIGLSGIELGKSHTISFVCSEWKIDGRVNGTIAITAGIDA
jgi:hypothetical protein